MFQERACVLRQGPAQLLCTRAVRRDPRLSARSARTSPFAQEERPHSLKSHCLPRHIQTSATERKRLARPITAPAAACTAYAAHPSAVCGSSGPLRSRTQGPLHRQCVRGLSMQQEAGALTHRMPMVYQMRPRFPPKTRALRGPHSGVSRLPGGHPHTATE